MFQLLLVKTFGGLSARYYARQFFFGAGFSVFFILLDHGGASSLAIGPWLFILMNAFLYPYARFVYDRVIGFIVGDNIFIINFWVMMLVKFITMVLCWVMALFIAPIGLLYLYVHHTFQNKKS